MSHTYATLEVSPGTFKEIARRLDAAGYDHAFEDTRKGRVIDMHGIGLLTMGKDPSSYHNAVLRPIIDNLLTPFVEGTATKESSMVLLESVIVGVLKTVTTEVDRAVIFEHMLDNVMKRLHDQEGTGR